MIQPAPGLSAATSRLQTGPNLLTFIYWRFSLCGNSTMPFSDFTGRSVHRLSAIPVAPLPSKVIPFYIFRNSDVNGFSGCGIVAEGVIFSSGKCVMQWLHEIASVATFDSVADLLAIHGHGGKTIVYCWQ